MSNDFKLCYIDRPWAYFTTAHLLNQWGDDWNDAPYECNAGPPYEWSERRECPKYDLLKVAFDGDMDTPADCGQSYSVEEINKCATPWLHHYCVSGHGADTLWAGATLDEFASWIASVGGRVYWARP